MIQVTVAPDSRRKLNTGRAWEVRAYNPATSNGRIQRIDCAFDEDPCPLVEKALANLGLHVGAWTHHPATGAYSAEATS